MPQAPANLPRMQHTLTVQTERLTLTVTATSVGLLYGWDVVVTHPEGGSALYRVIRHEGRYYVMNRPDCPEPVTSAVQSLMWRCGAWHRAQLSGSGATLDQAIQQNSY